MAGICSQCGCTLPEEGTVCPRCGAPLQDRTAPVLTESDPIPEVSKKPKLKWWIIAIPVVVVLVVLIAALWTPLSIRFAPEAALASAAAKTGLELAQRYQNSPYTVFSCAYNEEGKNTVALRMDLDTGYSIMDFNMNFAVDSKMQAMQADLLIGGEGDRMDIGFYMDAECAALGSESLLGNTYYGITYETFSQDLRGNDLMGYLFDDETLTQMETFVDSLKSNMQMAKEADPALSEAYKKILTDFTKELTAQVGSEKLTLNGQEHRCHIISYTATGEQIADVLDQIQLAMESDEATRGMYTDEEWEDYLGPLQKTEESFRSDIADCTISFFLYKGRLADVQIVVNGVHEDGAQTIQMELNLGTDAASDNILLSFQAMDGDTEDFILCTLSTAQDDTHYSEALDIVIQKSEGVEDSLCISYDWDPKTGDLAVDILSADASYRLDWNLKEEDSGYTLAIDDIVDLILLFAEDPYSLYEDMVLSVQMSVTSGAEISKPEYQNLDTWSLGDLYLFAGMG